MDIKNSLVTTRQRVWLRQLLNRQLKSTFFVPVLGAGLLMGGGMAAHAADHSAASGSDLTSAITDINNNPDVNGDTISLTNDPVNLDANTDIYLTANNSVLIKDNSLDLNTFKLSVNPANLLDINSSITGTGTIFKVGDGTLVLSGNNDFTPSSGLVGVTVTGGTLKLANNHALGAESNYLNAYHGTTVDYASGIEIKNNIWLDDSTNNTLPNVQLNVADHTTATQSGVISGPNTGPGITKTGGGRLILSNSNTYAGGTDLKAGTIQLQNNGALGTGALTADGGSLEFYNGATNVANDIALNSNLGLYVNSGLITDLSGTISGTNKDITKTGDGTLKLSGDNSSTFIGGGTQVYQGTLELGNSNALGTSNLIINPADSNNYSKTVDYDNGVIINNNVVLHDNVTLNVDGTDSATQSGIISDFGGSYGVTKTGSGGLTFTNTNTYSGDTVVNGGTLYNQGELTNSHVVVNTDGTFTNQGKVDQGVAVSGGNSYNGYYGDSSSVTGGVTVSTGGAFYNGYYGNSNSITGAVTVDDSNFYNGYYGNDNSITGDVAVKNAGYFVNGYWGNDNTITGDVTVGSGVGDKSTFANTNGGSITGHVTVDGSADWGSANLDNGGAITGDVDVNNGTLKNETGATITGTVNVNGTGDAYVNNNGTIDGAVNVNGGLDAYGPYTGGFDNNGGTVTGGLTVGGTSAHLAIATNGTDTSVIGNSTPGGVGVTVNAYGEFDNSSGEVHQGVLVNKDGTFNNSNNGHVYDGVTVSGGAFTNDHSFVTGDVTVKGHGSFSNQNGAEVNGDSLIVKGKARFNNDGVVGPSIISSVNVDNITIGKAGATTGDGSMGVFNNNDDGSVKTSSLTIQGNGWFANQGLSAPSLLEADNVVLNDQGRFTNNSVGSVDLTGDGHQGNVTVNGSGEFDNWGGGQLTTGDVALFDNGTFSNKNGSTTSIDDLTVADNSSVSNVGGNIDAVEINVGGHGKFTNDSGNVNAYSGIDVDGHGTFVNKGDGEVGDINGQPAFVAVEGNGTFKNTQAGKVAGFVLLDGNGHLLNKGNGGVVVDQNSAPDALDNTATIFGFVGAVGESTFDNSSNVEGIVFGAQDSSMTNSGVIESGNFVNFLGGQQGPLPTGIPSVLLYGNSSFTNQDHGKVVGDVYIGYVPDEIGVTQQDLDDAGLGNLGILNSTSSFVNEDGASIDGDVYVGGAANSVTGYNLLNEAHGVITGDIYGSGNAVIENYGDPNNVYLTDSSTALNSGSFAVVNNVQTLKHSLFTNTDGATVQGDVNAKNHSQIINDSTIEGKVTLGNNAILSNTGDIANGVQVNGSATANNSGTVSGLTKVNGGNFNNKPGGNVDNAVITGTGTFTNDGAINGWTSISSQGTLVNNAGGTLGATVQVGNSSGDTNPGDYSTFINHGNVSSTAVSVYGGDGDHVNFDNTGTTGDVTAYDYSYSVNEANATVGDVGLYNHSIFDNYGNAGDVVAYDSSFFTNEVGSHADSLISYGGTVINEGVLDNAYYYGGTQYNSGTVGNLTIADDAIYYNNSEDESKTGTVTGNVTVGTQGDPSDYSVFHNAVDGDTVGGNVIVNSFGTFENGNGGAVGSAGAPVTITVNDFGTYENLNGSTSYGHAVINDNGVFINDPSEHHGGVLINTSSTTSYNDGDLYGGPGVPGVEITGTGTFTNKDGGNVYDGVVMSNGVFDNQAGSTVHATGDDNTSGIAVNVSGGVFYNQDTAVVDGNVQVSNTGTFSNNTGSKVIGDAKVTGGLFLSDGELTGTANVSGTGQFNNEANGKVDNGVVLNGSAIAVNSGTIDQGSAANAVKLQASSVFTNSGQITGTVLVGGGTSTSKSTFTNESGATIDGNVTVNNADVNLVGGYDYNLDNEGTITGNVTGKGVSIIVNNHIIGGNALIDGNGSQFANTGQIGQNATAQNFGTFSNDAGGKIVGDAAVTTSGHFYNLGEISQNASATNGGTFVNEVSGGDRGVVDGSALVDGGSSNFYNYGTVTQGATAQNGGTFINYGGGIVNGGAAVDGGHFINQTNGLVTGGATLSDGTFDNTGGIVRGGETVTGGTFNNNNGGAVRGGLTVGDGTPNSGIFNNGGATLGAGKVYDGITLHTGGTVNNAAGSNVYGHGPGTFAVTMDGGEFNNSGTTGGVDQSGGVFNNANGGRVNNGVTQSGGTFTNHTGGTVDGGVDQSGGNFGNYGVVKNTGGGDAVTLSGTGHFANYNTVDGDVQQSGGTFDNSGEVTGGVTEIGGLFTNHTGGTVDNGVDQSGGTFRNYGDVENLGGGAAVTLSGGAFGNYGTVTGDVNESDGLFTNHAGATVDGNIDQSGGDFNNEGHVTGTVDVYTGGDFENKGTGVIDGLVTVGQDGVAGKSTFDNAGTVNNDVIVHGGDGTFTPGQWDFHNTGTINGSVTADDQSFSDNAGHITGNVTVNEFAHFDNEVHGVIDGTALVESTATFHNYGQLGGAGVEGGIMYNTGTVGDVTVVRDDTNGKDGYFYNNSEDGTVAGKVTGNVTVGNSPEDADDYSVFHNDVAGDEVDGNVTINSHGTFSNDNGGVVGSDASKTVTINDDGTFNNDHGSTVNGHVVIEDNGTLNNLNNSVIQNGVENHGGTFYNDPAVVNGGYVQTAGTGTNDGGAVINGVGAAGSVGYIPGVDISGGTFSNQNSAVINNGIVQSGGDFTNQTAGWVNGGLDQTGGTFTNWGDGTAVNGGVTVNGADASFTNSNSATVNGGFTLVDGTVINQAGGWINGGLDQTGGSFTNWGDSTAVNDGVTVDGADASFTNSNSATVNGGFTLVDGTVINQAGGWINGGLDQTGGSFTNWGAGTAVNGGVIVNGADAAFHNSNNATVNGGIQLQDGNVVNDAAGWVNGLVDQSGGTFTNWGTGSTLNDGASVSGGTLSNQSNAVINKGVEGWNDGHIINDATINADGTGTAATLHGASTLDNQANGNINGNVRTWGTSELTNDGIITGNVGMNAQSTVYNNNLIDGNLTARDSSKFYSDGTVTGPITITDNAKMFVTDDSQDSQGNVFLTGNGSLTIGGETLSGGALDRNTHEGNVDLGAATTNVFIGKDTINNDNSNIVPPLTANKGLNFITNTLNAVSVTGDGGGALELGGDNINSSNLGGTVNPGFLSFILGGNVITNTLNATSVTGNSSLSLGQSVITANNTGTVNGNGYYTLGANVVTNTLNAAGGVTLDNDITLGGSTINSENTGQLTNSVLGANLISNEIDGNVNAGANTVALGGDTINSGNYGTVSNSNIGGNIVSNVIDGKVTIEGGALVLGSDQINATHNTIGNYISNNVSNAAVSNGALNVYGGQINGEDAYDNQIDNTLESATISNSDVLIQGGTISGTGANHNKITNDIDPIVSGSGYLDIYGGVISGDSNHDNALTNTFTGSVNTGSVYMGGDSGANTGYISGDGVYNDSIANEIDGAVTVSDSINLGHDDLQVTNGSGNTLTNTITGDINGAAGVSLGGDTLSGSGNGNAHGNNVLSNVVGDISNVSGDIWLSGDKITGNNNSFSHLTNSAGNVQAGGSVNLGYNHLDGNNAAENTISNTTGSIDSGSTVNLVDNEINGGDAASNRVFNIANGDVNADGAVLLAYNNVIGTDANDNRVFNIINGGVTTKSTLDLAGNQISGDNAEGNRAFNIVRGDVQADGAVTLDYNSVTGDDSSDNRAFNIVDGNIQSGGAVTLSSNTIGGNNTSGNRAFNVVTGYVAAIDATNGSVSLGGNTIAASNAGGNAAFNKVEDGIIASDTVSLTGNTITGAYANDNVAFNKVQVVDSEQNYAIETGGNVFMTGNDITASAGNAQGNILFNKVEGNVVAHDGDVTLGFNSIEGSYAQGNTLFNKIGTSDIAASVEANDLYLGNDSISGTAAAGNTLFNTITGDAIVTGDVVLGNNAIGSLDGSQLTNDAIANSFSNEIDGNVYTSSGKVLLGGDVISGSYNRGVDLGQGNGNSFTNTIGGSITGVDTVALSGGVINGGSNTDNNFTNTVGSIDTTGAVQIGYGAINGGFNAGNTMTNTAGDIGDITKASQVVVGHDAITGDSNSGNDFENTTGAINAVGPVELGYGSINGADNTGNTLTNTVGDVSVTGGAVSVIGGSIIGNSNSGNTISNTVGNIDPPTTVTIGSNTISGVDATNNAIFNIVASAEATGLVQIGSNSITGDGASTNSAYNSISGNVISQSGGVNVGTNSASGQNATNNFSYNAIGGSVSANGDINIVGNTISGLSATVNNVYNAVGNDVTSTSGGVNVGNNTITGQGASGNNARNNIGGNITASSDINIGWNNIGGDGASFDSVYSNSAYNNVTGDVTSQNGGVYVASNIIGGTNSSNNLATNIIGGAIIANDDAQIGGNQITGAGANHNTASNVITAAVISNYGNVGLTSNIIDGTNNNNNIASNAVHGGILASNDISIVGNQITGQGAANDQASNEVTFNVTSTYGGVNVGSNSIAGQGASANNAYNAVGGNISANNDINIVGNTISGQNATVNNAYNAVGGDVTSTFGGVNVGNNSISGQGASGNNAYNNIGGNITANGDVNIGWNSIDGQGASSNTASNNVGGNVATDGNIYLGVSTISGQGNHNNIINNTISGAVTSANDVFLGNGQISGEGVHNDSIKNIITGTVGATGDVRLGAADSISSTGSVNVHDNSIVNKIGATTSASSVVLGGGSISATEANTNTIRNVVAGNVTVKDGVIGLIGGDISGVANGADNTIVNRVMGNIIANGSTATVFSNSIADDGNGNFVENLVNGNLTQNGTSTLAVLGNNNIVNGSTGVTMNDQSSGGIGVTDVTGSDITQNNSLDVPNGTVQINDNAGFGVGRKNTVTGDDNVINNTLNAPNGVFVNGTEAAAFGIGTLGHVDGNGNVITNVSNGALTVDGGLGAGIGYGAQISGDGNNITNTQNGDVALSGTNNSLVVVGGATVTGNDNAQTNTIIGNADVTSGYFELGTQDGAIVGNPALNGNLTGDGNTISNNLGTDGSGNGNLNLSGTGVGVIGGSASAITGNSNTVNNTVWGATEVNGTQFNMLGGSNTVDGADNTITNTLKSTLDATNGSFVNINAGVLASTETSTGNTQENVIEGNITLLDSQLNLTGDTSDLNTRVAGNTVQNVLNGKLTIRRDAGHVTGDNNFANGGVLVTGNANHGGSLQIEGRDVNKDLQTLINSLEGDVQLGNANTSLLVGSDTQYTANIDGNTNNVTNELIGNVDVGSGQVIIGGISGVTQPHTITGDDNTVTNTVTGNLTDLQAGGKVLLGAGDYTVDGDTNTVTNKLTQNFDLLNGNTMALNGGNLTATGTGNTLNDVIDGNINVGSFGNDSPNINVLIMQGGTVNTGVGAVNENTNFASDGDGNAVNNVITGAVNVYDNGFMMVNGENNYVVGGVTANDPGNVYVGSNDVSTTGQTVNNTLIANTAATAAGQVHLGETLGTQVISGDGNTVTNTIKSGINPLPPGQFLDGKVEVTNGGVLTLGSGIHQGTGSDNIINNVLGVVKDINGNDVRQVQPVTGGSTVQLGGGDYTGVTGTGNTVNNTLDQGLQVTDSVLGLAGTAGAGASNVTVRNTVTGSVAANGTAEVDFIQSNGTNVTNTIDGHVSLNDSSSLFAQDGSAAGGGNVVGGYINLNGTNGVFVGASNEINQDRDNSLNSIIHFRNSDSSVVIGSTLTGNDGGTHKVTNTHFGVIDTTVAGEGGQVALSGTVNGAGNSNSSILNTQNGDVALDGENSAVILSGSFTNDGTATNSISNTVANDVDVTDGMVIFDKGDFTAATTGTNTLTNTVDGNVDMRGAGVLLFNGDSDTADANDVTNHITQVATLYDGADTIVKGANNSIDGGLVLNTTTSTELNPLPGDGGDEHNDVTQAIIGGGDTANASTGNVLNELTVGGSGVVINANPNASAQRAEDHGYDIDSGHLYVGAFGNTNTADGQSITNQLNGNVTLNGGASQVNGYSTGGGMVVLGAANNNLLNNDGTVINEITGTVDLNGGSRLHLGGDQFDPAGDGTGSVTNKIDGAVTAGDNSFIAMWGENDPRLHNVIDNTLTLSDNALFHAEGVDNSVTGGTTLEGTAIATLGGSGGSHAPVSNIASDFTLNTQSQLFMGATGEFLQSIPSVDYSLIQNNIIGDVAVNDSSILHVLSGGTGGLNSAIGFSTISGDLSFDNGSTFNVNLDQNTATGVKVGGTATPGGATVKVNVFDSNDGPFHFGREYNIINATAVNGTFSDVDETGMLPAIDLKLVYPDTQNVDLKIQTKFANNSALSGTVNEQNFAAYLDKQSPAAGSGGVNSDLNDLLNSLVQQTGQTGNLQPLNAYLGDTYAAFDTAGYWNANRFVNQVATHNLESRGTDWTQSFALNSTEGIGGMSSQMSLVKQLTNARPVYGFVSTNAQVVDYDNGDDNVKNNGLWADVSGVRLNNDGNSHLGSPDFSENTKSVTVGYQGGSHNFSWGVVGGYHDGDFNFNNRNATGDQDGWDLGLNGLYQSDSGTYVNGVLAYNHDSNSLTRNDGFGGANKSDFGSHTLSAMVEVGKRIKRDNNITYTPYVSLLGVKYNRDGVTEDYSGSGPNTGLQVNGASNSYLTSNLGIRVGKTYLDKNGDKKAGVMLGLSWMHQFSDTDLPVTAALQSGMPGTGMFTVYGTPLSKNSVGVQLGGYGRLSRNVLGFLNYSGSFGSNQKVNSITAGLEYQF